jgi:hypothetical protein
MKCIGGNFQCSYFFLDKKVTKSQDEKMLPPSYHAHTPLFRRARARIMLVAALKLTRPFTAPHLFQIIRS